MRTPFHYLVPALLAAGALAAGAAARQNDARQPMTTPEEQAAIARELKGLVPGPAANCLPSAITRSASSEVYGPTIIYRASSGLKYRSDANTRCGRQGGNRQWDILVTNTPIGQTCSGDPVRLIDRNTGMLTGVCALGEFVPYRRP